MWVLQVQHKKSFGVYKSYLELLEPYMWKRYAENLYLLTPCGPNKGYVIRHVGYTHGYFDVTSGVMTLQYVLMTLLMEDQTSVPVQ